MTKPEHHPTSIPASAVYTVLKAIASTLSAIHQRVDRYPLHDAAWILQESLGRARKEAGLSPTEDEAFRDLQDRFRQMWKSLEESQ